MGPAPFEQEIYNSDLVFVGSPESAPVGRQLSIRVLTILKGQAGPASVITVDGSPAIDFRYAPGRSYLFFLDVASDSPPTASHRLRFCTPTREIAADSRELLDRLRRIVHDQSLTTDRPTVGIYPPIRINDAVPVWPVEARTPRDQSVEAVTVILEFTITAEGVPSGVHVLRSVLGFDAAAIATVLKLRFIPMLVDGVPTPIVKTEVVRFTR
ncbi:MAG: TonB family protein [Vicinamibacterales bacterium]